MNPITTLTFQWMVSTVGFLENSQKQKKTKALWTHNMLICGRCVSLVRVPFRTIP